LNEHCSYEHQSFEKDNKIKNHLKVRTQIKKGFIGIIVALQYL